MRAHWPCRTGLGEARTSSTPESGPCTERRQPKKTVNVGDKLLIVWHFCTCALVVRTSQDCSRQHVEQHLNAFVQQILIVSQTLLNLYCALKCNRDHCGEDVENIALKVTLRCFECILSLLFGRPRCVLLRCQVADAANEHTCTVFFCQRQLD